MMNMRRAYAELLEDEQELEAARMLEEQARAADAQELHKKELELKRLRAVDNKEKRRLLRERKDLEAEFADTNRLQEKQVSKRSCALRQLVAPHGWGDPAGRVNTCRPALYSSWREPGVVVCVSPSHVCRLRAPCMLKRGLPPFNHGCRTRTSRRSCPRSTTR
jgi:hypothetical protein